MTRNLLLLAALAGALSLAACGGGNDGTAGDREDQAYESALKFAKCLRGHGVDAPDPVRTADGGIQQRIGRPAAPGKAERGLGPGEDPKMQAAEKACAKYRLSGGDAPDPKRLAQQRDAFVAYARCMRGKGIDMPDPKVTGNGIAMALGRGVRPDSAVFKAADKACHPLLGQPPEGAKGGATAVGPAAGPAGGQTP